ncbi:unnamed protein product, partial [Discosporangium mesarthrocarpum]
MAAPSSMDVEARIKEQRAAINSKRNARLALIQAQQEMKQLELLEKQRRDAARLEAARLAKQEAEARAREQNLLRQQEAERRRGEMERREREEREKERRDWEEKTKKAPAASSSSATSMAATVVVQSSLAGKEALSSKPAPVKPIAELPGPGPRGSGRPTVSGKTGGGVATAAPPCPSAVSSQGAVAANACPGPGRDRPPGARAVAGAGALAGAVGGEETGVAEGGERPRKGVPVLAMATTEAGTGTNSG